MKKLFGIFIAVGAAIAGILALLSSPSKSKKEFSRRKDANDKKLEFITKKATKVKADKKATKSKIKKTTAKVKSTKAKVKSTKKAKSTIDNFEKKYRK
tara:strand:+ start:337 stop:630 length:294 start_codon:yes stop_codon:yes gene_type:complete